MRFICFYSDQRNSRHLKLAIVFAWIAMAIASRSSAIEPSTDPVAANTKLFESRIRPLLIQHCYDCHSADTAEGKLRLDIKDGWQRGGERGPAIVPGDPSSSLLMRAVSYRDAKLKMPPEEAGGKLTETEIADLTMWIRNGAFDPRDEERVITDIEQRAEQHWAFQPISPPTIPPQVHPIDYLVQRRLESTGFDTTELANPRTLARRATFDLHGLPPTDEQIALAEHDFAGLVHQLLESPRYGERWARHWLDVARYSDAKDGVLMYGDARVRPFAYTYRDWVIRAWNDDKPVDQFIREQIAADLLGLPEDSPDLAALGFLTLGRMFDQNRHDIIDDQIDVLGRGLMGLSLACARCHDHKFDPVPTADYYSLYGVFASCYEPYELPRIGPVTQTGQAFEQEFSSKLREVMDKQQSLYEETLRVARQRTPDYLVHVATSDPDVAETTIFALSLTPEQLRPQITRRWRHLIAQRVYPEDILFGPWHDLMREPVLQPELWRQRGIDSRVIDGLVAANPKTPAEIARVYGDILVNAWLANPSEEDQLASLLVSKSGPIWFPARETSNYLSRQPGDAFRGQFGELDALAVKHADAAPRAMVLHDAEVLCDPVIFLRGDPTARGSPVPRQFLGFLTGPQRKPFQRGSGRRELAEAITSSENPLTARVWVERVWMHHFGQPLIQTPGDFGLQSAVPAQSELLDFLAAFFIQNGWRNKPLHELIMSSETYRRSSHSVPSARFEQQFEADPDNRLLWRYNRRRMDFEQFRDSLLYLSGELDNSMYGRPKSLTDESNNRRTIYAFVERQNIPDVIQTFDVASPDTSTPQRNLTIVPQQALFALNSSFMLARSDALADRCLETIFGTSQDDLGDIVLDGTQKNEFVHQLFRKVYSRQPTPAEVEWSVQFLERGSPSQFAQVLLMSNELMFID